MKIPKNTLIYDIETATYGADVSEPTKHKMKFFGAYSYKTDEYYCIPVENKIEIIQLLKTHKFLVGFNNKYYDNVVLEHENYDIKYKIIIDLRRIIEQRMDLIKFKDSILTYYLTSLSLDDITRVIGLTDKNSSKKTLDYKMLDKQEHTPEELDNIKKYTIRDIEITKKLWEWIYELFDSWKHHIDITDANRLRHIYCATSVYAYKVICHKTGIQEEYGEEKIKSLKDLGGYVAYPAIEKVEGNIYCVDFASLYPHIMIQCNLFGRDKNNKVGWHGDNIFHPEGYYDDKNISKISNMLFQIYQERKAYKVNNDPREYGLKIVMNTIYGLLRNNIFKNVYDDVAGNDCCILGQEWIKMARQYFMDAGYFVFYTDTDSIYLQDKFDNKQQLMDTIDKAISKIKEHIPFPKSTFNLDIDYEIVFIHFFRPYNIKIKTDEHLDEYDEQAKKLGLLKKNYIFVYKKYNKDGTYNLNVYIKNLGIVKRSNSKLSKKIFWDKIVPIIIKDKTIKFSNEQIKKWIKDYLIEDISLIVKRLSVKSKKNYKSKTCLNIQAHDYIPKNTTNKLGPGIHFLVPNKKLGIGKGASKYCTFNEYMSLLSYEDLNLNVVMSELSYFNNNYVKETIKKVKEVPFEDTLKQLGLW